LRIRSEEMGTREEGNTGMRRGSRGERRGNGEWRLGNTTNALMKNYYRP